MKIWATEPTMRTMVAMQRTPPQTVKSVFEKTAYRVRAETIVNVKIPARRIVSLSVNAVAPVLRKKSKFPFLQFFTLGRT